MGRKIASEREARQCLGAAKAAGQSVGAWAREHGIDGRSLHAWGTNLARSGKAGPRLVELVPSPPSRLEPRYVVRVGELAVELGDDFCEETVVRLVRALRAC
jgi:transposase-like protein